MPRFRIALRQLYLQEFTAATSFVTVLRTQKAYSVHRAAIGRRGALEEREIQLDVPGEFRDVSFQVAAGRCVYAAQTFDTTAIHELFRCPADIEVATLARDEKPSLRGSFHLVVANLFPELRGAFYTVEFATPECTFYYELPARHVGAGLEEWQEAEPEADLSLECGASARPFVQLVLDSVEYALCGVDTGNINSVNSGNSTNANANATNSSVNNPNNPNNADRATNSADSSSTANTTTNTVAVANSNANVNVNSTAGAINGINAINTINSINSINTTNTANTTTNTANITTNVTNVTANTATNTTDTAAAAAATNTNTTNNTTINTNTNTNTSNTSNTTNNTNNTCTAAVVLHAHGTAATLLRVLLSDSIGTPYAFYRAASFTETAARWPVQHELYAPGPPGPTVMGEQRASNLSSVRQAQFCVLSGDLLGGGGSLGEARSLGGGQSLERGQSLSAGRSLAAAQSLGTALQTPALVSVWLGPRRIPFLARSGARFYSNLVPCARECGGRGRGPERERERVTVFAGEGQFELSLDAGPQVLIDGYRFVLSAPRQPITDETISLQPVSQPTSLPQSQSQPQSQPVSPSSRRLKTTQNIAPILAESAICGDCGQQQHHLRRLRVETQLVEQMRQVQYIGFQYKKTAALAEQAAFYNKTTTRGAKIERVLLSLEKCFRNNETAFQMQYNNAVITSLLRRIKRRGLEVPDAVLRRLGELQLLQCWD